MSLRNRGVALALIMAIGSVAGCADLVEQAAGAALDAAGCIDASGAQSTPDAFQYGGATACKSAQESHAWGNPMPYAMVQWAGAVLEGSLAVRVTDSAGREVSSFELGPETSAEAVQGRTAPGFPAPAPPLSWTVEMTFTNFTGTMGLQLVASAPPAAPSAPDDVLARVQSRPLSS